MMLFLCVCVHCVHVPPLLTEYKQRVKNYCKSSIILVCVFNEWHFNVVIVILPPTPHTCLIEIEEIKNDFVSDLFYIQIVTINFDVDSVRTQYF